MMSTSPRVRAVVGRIVIAMLVGVASGWFTFTQLASRPQWLAHDFTFPWRAARALMAGENPYAAASRLTGPWPQSGNYFYPLPNALVALPFAPFPPAVAGALFFGVSAALLAFGLTRDGFWRLAVLASAPFLMAAFTVQWAPLVASAALLVPLGFAMATKPNLGLVALAYRPRLDAVWSMVAIGTISLAILPRWPLDWFTIIRRPPPHIPVLLWPFGFVGLLGALRWRTPEGRLLLAATLLPAVPWYYDQFLLWLIPRTFGQIAFLTACSWVSWLLVFTTQSLDFTHGMRHLEPFITLGVFLPAALVVLRQPNRPNNDLSPLAAGSPAGANGRSAR